MTFKITDEALELLNDFIKYSDLNKEEMADIMYYDLQGFRIKLTELKKQIEEGNKCQNT